MKANEKTSCLSSALLAGLALILAGTGSVLAEVHYVDMNCHQRDGALYRLEHGRNEFRLRWMRP